MQFFDKLLYAIERNQSLLYVGLDPDLDEMVVSENGDKTLLLSQLWEWLDTVIAQTEDLVCAYKPILGFYQALGAPGLELLKQTLHRIPPHIPIILDAKHSDIHTSTVFAKTAFEEWRVDAVTLSPYAGWDHVAPFLVYPDKAVFVLCANANPSAAVLQEYPLPSQPFYLHLVNEAKNWGTPAQLGLKVGGTPEILARIRSVAPERLILLQEDAAEMHDLATILAAGLDKQGEGLLVPVPPSIIEEPGRNIAEAVRQLRDTVNEERLRIVQGNPTCELWLPNVCLLQSEPHRDLILQLYDIGCIIFGEHKQASGAIFPYYIDLRKIISQPQIFHKILSAYADILQKLEFDRIAGIPYGSLPTATGLSLRLERPMVYPRKEVKAHGTQKVIEGNFHPGETVVVVDDILISGKSAIEGAEKLKSVGLKVEDIVVFIDHEKGVKDRLKAQGYQAYSVLSITQISETLYNAGRVDDEQFKLLMWEH
ncbi:bifunctional orotidine-5'-phosphate decarboxylase/orotate phosphoribosyltransferase [Argonema antarcticum]|uniref:bifunctional orotidine-5'-phosphate decarboxylase/orotate phosphoribosyltransferase n=1 Tax=Argonema antarcticum TaxID=2942763 RepID=UPI0020118877|nr:bifunctional orotidine-5'-phosphate decarboxylase/orotate phosphoribosyltransferase [Argonema antarcticum]MCL1472628.1 bifunctional orotidine-5'-phosphate decarboxylase/orotate phosphoribosyltransferase [Argonema antarcticum A004/B2]